MKNLCGKMRRTDKGEKPYEIWVSRDGTWKWEVLKKWQADDSKPYARAFCAVTSPFTGQPELGDVYISEIKENARLVETNY